MESLKQPQKCWMDTEVDAGRLSIFTEPSLSHQSTTILDPASDPQITIMKTPVADDLQSMVLDSRESNQSI